MLGADAIERQFGSGLLLLLWALFAFLLPTAAATADLRVLVHDWRRWGVFSPRGIIHGTSDDRLKSFFIPAWIRIGVWFVSVVVSTFALKAIGLDL